MKIIYLANARIPTEKAHGFQIMKMSEAFSLAGEEVELVLPTKKNEEFENINPFDYYQIKKVFKIKKVFAFDPDCLIEPFSGVYIKIQTLFFLLSLFIYLLFKKRKKNYFFYTRDEIILPLLSLFSKKIIWECHSLPKNVKFYKKYWQRCLKIVVLTQSLKAELIRIGIRGDKIIIAPDAVDLEVFAINLNKEEARKESDLPLAKIIIGYTGSFRTKNMDKGIIDILKALAILKSEIKDILFLAVGGSQPDIDYYQQLAKQEGVSELILFLPRVEQKKLAVFQKAADILLMPFPDKVHYRYYMSPMKLFEYMASARPIVASDLPSIREVLNDNNSILVKPDNPDSLAEGIKKALQNSELSDKITRQAFREVGNYTWQKRGQNIINFIKQ